jgi:hypothetical protein
MDYAANIANFRQRAVALASDLDEKQYIQARLHEPTKCLRQGDVIDESRFLEDLADALVTRRIKAGTKASTSYQNQQGLG